MRKLVCLVLVMGMAVTFAAQQSSISQYGITWTFNQGYECGQFANGDWWVVGPVIITSITPPAFVDAIDGGTGICDGWSNGYAACQNYCQTNAPGYSSNCDCMFASDPGCQVATNHCRCAKIRNGWEVNPVVKGPQGFDDRTGGFDAALVPALPYTASPGQSVVKVISDTTKTTYEMLYTAAVLTVVDAIPPDSGRTVFRPPYVGTEKPYYSINEMHTELLPAGYAPVPNTPTLDWVKNAFERVQLDHKEGGLGRFIHPFLNIPDYGADIGQRNGDGALRLMLNDPLAAKLPALIAYVQYGIDLYHMILYGQTWPDGGGHRPGQKLPLAFAAAILDHQAMKDSVNHSAYMEEDKGVYWSEKAGRALYGFVNHFDERSYWALVEDYNAGYRAHPDPYGYIDGGPHPGTSYQLCCTTQPWKGEVLAALLMPALQAVWCDTELINYLDRWVDFGTWAQPDPCAPFDSNTANYGKTYGPDGNGDCIRDTDPSDGIGRFPDLHGTNKDAGGRYSNFQKEMWNAYRSTVDIKDRYRKDPQTGPSGRTFLAVAPCPFDLKSGYLALRWTGAAGPDRAIAIYDHQGQTIKTLHPGQLAGMRWDGTDRNGEPVKPGVYYAGIGTNGYFMVKQFIVIK